MIRGVELSKSRTQALLGFATISFLSVGTNRGIGYVEFDNAADPERLQSAVLELLEKQREQTLEDDEDESNAATDDSSPRGQNQQADAPPASRSATDGSDRTEPDDTDDPLAEPNASGGGDARRPVSGNDDAPSPAEPDTRD